MLWCMQATRKQQHGTERKTKARAKAASAVSAARDSRRHSHNKQRAFALEVDLKPADQRQQCYIFIILVVPPFQHYINLKKMFSVFRSQGHTFRVKQRSGGCVASG
jgi:hypothetical protein